MWRRFGPVLIICAFALLARLWIVTRYPNEIHPDETFQYLEQAYRVVTGRGMVPWEYLVGARSWIIPGLLIPVIAIARMLSGSPDVTLFAVAFTVSVASLIVVASAYVLGRRVCGEAGGIFAAIIVALWPEIVLMSPHVLADTVSTIPLMWALAIGYRPGKQVAGGKGALIATGVLLSVAAVLRPQLLPAILIAGFWIARLDFRRYIAMAIGMIPVLIVFGLVDWLTWGVPFGSIIRYVAANQGGIAASFGVQPFQYYFGRAFLIWNVGAPIIGLTALMGMRRLPLLGVMSFLIVLTFSSIGHKEYRFIYPVLPLLFTLCGVGTVKIARWSVEKFSQRWRRTATIVLVATWLIAGVATATSSRYLAILHRNQSIFVEIEAINADPNICGVGILPADRWHEVGTVRFRDDIPLYSAASPVDQSAAYNALLVIDEEPPRNVIQSGFRVMSCASGDPAVCFLQRNLRCDASRGLPLRSTANPAVQQLLKRMGLAG